ncbi:MAG: glutamate-5-semialdehyde dehydrogenase [Anaerolineae bacterium]|nr:glutamate-5-semialdehyde dehydrogenase [Anaerolineae bacterium]
MLLEMGKRARFAARSLALAPAIKKQNMLESLVDLIRLNIDAIIQANQVDISAAQQAGLDAAMIDRLMLNEARLQGICSDLLRVAALPDPVGETFDASELPNGLKLCKKRVPLGVLAVIYESRPNVTLDISGLALKSGNAVILRGGSETIHTNRCLVNLVRSVLEAENLPVDSVQFIDSPDRSLVAELLKMHDAIDMLIPRGGAALHRFCRENSLIPVITGGIGICHLYVDESADLPQSIEVICNAKVQRPTVCNALDTVLVNRKVAADFLPRLVQHLAVYGVSFRADGSALPYLPAENDGRVLPAGPDDFDTEWLSLVLGLKVVDSLDQAIAHITQHSTGHSDGILTADPHNADLFVATVDSAAVYVNASTRFTDGSQFGLGAEVAISTQRLHARGPMGLRELTTYKWVCIGNYHTRV